MIPNLYLHATIGALVGAVALYGGSQLEHGRHVEREAVAAARIEKAKAKLQDAFDNIATADAIATKIQTQTFTEIRRVAGPIVYRNTSVCIPAADSGLLDRARDAANSSALAREPDDGAAPVAGVPTQR